MDKFSLDSKQNEWEQSYRNRDNYVFYPHEEVIRFVSKYIRKRIGLCEFHNVISGNEKVKMLDLGCGIGRHLIYAHEMGIKGYGIDLSNEAISVAKEWLKNKGMTYDEECIVQGDIRDLPWQNNFFDFVISHGVLDSVSFGIAMQAVREVHRVTKNNGLFYCDLISGDDSAHAREYAGEEVVQTKHENGTIQSYFNFSKIEKLFGDYFVIEECLLIKREDVLSSGGSTARYHIILRKK